MARTRYPKRDKVKTDRLRAQCERILNTPWPEVSVPDRVWEPLRARYLKTGQLQPISRRKR